MKSASLLFRLFASALSLALLLTSCTSTPSGSITNPASPRPGQIDDIRNNAPEPENLFEAWATNSKLTAKIVASDLEKSGLCGPAATWDSGWYYEEQLTDYENGHQRLCFTFGDGLDLYPDCPANIDIDTFNLDDPRRSLEYEDGSNVAIFYADNYQITITHTENGNFGIEEELSLCSDLLDAYKAKIGGSITLLGQFEPEPWTEEPTESPVAPSETSAPSDNRVVVPNLIGAYDKDVLPWLRANGYELTFFVESKIPGSAFGTNPDAGCLVTEHNIIFEQSPAAGTIVENSSSVILTGWVDCEYRQ